MRDMSYPCERYGERMEDYPECGPCPEDTCLACSLLTLENMFSNSNKKIEVILPQGTKVIISEPEEEEIDTTELGQQRLDDEEGYRDR